MNKRLVTFLLISLAAAAAPGVARARDHHDDHSGYSRIEDRMGELDARLARLAALRDRFGGDQYLRLEINRTANLMQHIRNELGEHEAPAWHLREETDVASGRLSRIEEQYREALAERPRHHVIFRSGY